MLPKVPKTFLQKILLLSVEKIFKNILKIFSQHNCFREGMGIFRSESGIFLAFSMPTLSLFLLFPLNLIV